MSSKITISAMIAASCGATEESLNCPVRLRQKPLRSSASLVMVGGITKNFGGVRALRGVDLEVLPGEVHALLGENGAGNRRSSRSSAASTAMMAARSRSTATRSLRHAGKVARGRHRRRLPGPEPGRIALGRRQSDARARAAHPLRLSQEAPADGGGRGVPEAASSRSIRVRPSARCPSPTGR